MADLLSRQELEVEVEFYSFALQEADDSLVPIRFPEELASEEFATFRTRRIDLTSGGHSHTALLSVEVWDGQPPPADDEAGCDAEAEGEIESVTGELAAYEMMGISETSIVLGRRDTLWRVRIQCSGRSEVYRLAQVDVPYGVERYLFRFWPSE
ncbi:hypothetical protein ACIQU6_26155 [Streptomyces sp. NPDC090442]|uniref:hypothetical protein n=1 Tax=Streptomyces sp. NPDC090442 TaxID=3365962 RepID=UPI0038143687